LLTALHGAIAAAVKIDLPGSPQNAFIRCRPSESQLRREAQDLIGDAAFARPESLRADAKNALVVGHRRTQLVTRVLRMTVAMTRQFDSGVRFLCNRRITQKRKDGVVKRRGGNFNLPPRRRLPIFFECY